MHLVKGNPSPFSPSSHYYLGGLAGVTEKLSFWCFVPCGGKMLVTPQGDWRTVFSFLNRLNQMSDSVHSLFCYHLSTLMFPPSRILGPCNLTRVLVFPYHFWILADTNGTDSVSDISLLNWGDLNYSVVGEERYRPSVSDGLPPSSPPPSLPLKSINQFFLKIFLLAGC